MFVLYYFEQDYDMVKFEIIATSKNRTAIEKKKQELEDIVKEQGKIIQQNMDNRNKWFAEVRQQIKEFLLRNLDAIKEPKGMHETRKDWHTSAGLPYHPEVVLARKKELINNIFNGNIWICHKNGAYERDRFLDVSKLKEPLLSFESYKETIPEGECHFGEYKIIEVEELDAAN